MSLNKLIKDKIPSPAALREALCLLSLSSKWHHIFSTFPKVLCVFRWSKSLLTTGCTPSFQSQQYNWRWSLSIPANKLKIHFFNFVRCFSLLSNFLLPISSLANLLPNLTFPFQIVLWNILPLSDPETTVETFDVSHFPSCLSGFFSVLAILLLKTPLGIQFCHSFTFHVRSRVLSFSFRPPHLPYT